jgi:hypothetical protein
VVILMEAGEFCFGGGQFIGEREVTDGAIHRRAR